MTQHEFFTEFNDVKEFYGASRYPQPLVERIWYHMQDVSVSEFRFMKTRIFDEYDQPPKVSAFLGYKRFTLDKRSPDQKEKPYVIECHKCKDCGFAWVQADPANSVWVFCSCDIGKDRKQVFYLDLPTHDYKLKLKEFPANWFKPVNKSQDDKVKEFLQELQSSNKYWVGEHV